jgi:hypothetical protein
LDLVAPADLLAMARRSFSRRAAVATGLVAIALYLGTYARVFFVPTSSTDAVAIPVLTRAQ